MRYFTDEQCDEMENTIYTIRSFVDILYGYCENYSDEKSIYPILQIIGLIDDEIHKITQRF